MCLALLAPPCTASAQSGDGAFCSLGPSDSRADYSVGARRNEIEVRVRGAGDPGKVICVMTVACTIKANPSLIIMDYWSGVQTSGIRPGWGDVKGISIRYADGARENCELKSRLEPSLLPDPKSMRPELDQATRDIFKATPK